jgi:competence protein ComEC
MSDRAAVGLAMSAAAGALHPWRPALLLGALALTAAVLSRSRRPVLLAAAVGLLASGLAQRALDGLDGLEARSVEGEVTLLSDPTPSFGGLRVDVRFGGRRLEARADGSAVRDLADRLAGEVLRIHGTVAPLEGDQRWMVARHLSGRLRVLRVDSWRPGDPAARLANGLRRTLVAGTSPLSDRQRSLFTGLVIGDDRHQPVDLADAFLGAGLTHLLAVSGQNVAFALAMVGPVLRRLRLWPRLLVTLAVIGLFGVMTRFEPSVLRASAMAALATTLAIGGRPMSRVRVIALAVAGLLLVDPLLVRSVGFQLSVSAALAIVVVAPRIAAVLPGPSALREALSVTLAAQLGVAPVLLATFGPIPVASLPANLVAVPVAGLVMIWGLTGGLAAGVVGEPVTSLLHGPTRLALGWLELVADHAARAPLGELRSAHVIGLALGLGIAVLARPGSRLRSVALSLAGGVVLTALVAAHAPPALRTSPLTGMVRWHAGTTDVVVLGGVGGRTSLAAPAILEALRRAEVADIDLLVVADPSVPEAVVDVVVRVHPTAAVVAQGAALLDAPPGSVVRPPADGTTVELGALLVRLVVVPDRLVVDAVPRPT